MLRPSGQYATPRRATWSGRFATRSSARYRIAPEKTRVIRDTVLRSVVLPAPLGPRRATISPPPTKGVPFSSPTPPPYPELTASSRKSGMEVGDVLAASKIGLLHDLALADLRRRALEQQLAMVE